jgi:hypothetical protein
MMQEKERIKVLRLKALISKQAKEENKANRQELWTKIKHDRINSRLDANREKIQSYNDTISAME